MPATILIVEDDPPTREMLEASLTADGHRVVAESEGEWALALMSAMPIDLALVDVRLPDLSGAEVRRRIEADPRTAQVPVMLLGGPEPDLSKPVDLDRLLARVRAELTGGRPRSASRPVLDQISGDLREITFGRIFGRLAQEKASGALLVQRRGAKKILFVQDGVPVFVRSNVLSESLGQVVLQEGLLSRVELDQVMRARRRSERSLGDLMVEQGLITEHQLAVALERQMEMKLFDLFEWEEGTAVHRPGAVHCGRRVSLPLSPLGIVYEGAARGMAGPRLERELSADRARNVRAVDGDKVRDLVLSLEPGALRLVEGLDGTRSVEALWDDPELGRDAAGRLLFALIVTGHVELHTAELPSLSQPLRRQVRSRVEMELRRIQRGATEAPDPEAVVRSVESTRARLAGLDLCAVLGLGPDPKPEEVQRAYARVSRELEPGKLLTGTESPEVVARAESNHLAAVRAFQVLSEPESAADYGAWLRDPRRDRHPTVQAVDAVEAARVAMLDDQWSRAQELLDAALDQVDDPYWRAERAFVHVMLNESEESARAFVEACAPFPGDARLWALQSLVLERQQKVGEATTALQRALGQDPGDPWVKRGLDRLDVRPQKTAKRLMPWRS